jgi:hypothetical protein
MADVQDMDTQAPMNKTDHAGIRTGVIAHR